MYTLNSYDNDLPMASHNIKIDSNTTTKQVALIDDANELSNKILKAVAALVIQASPCDLILFMMISLMFCWHLQAP